MADSALVQRHVNQWRHNRRFAKSISSTFRDWQITAIFYTALHAIDAALAQLGVQVSNHGERNDTVKNNESFSTVRTHYMNLYRISRITRYDADPDSWLPKEYLTITDLVEHILKPIENGITHLVKNVKFDPVHMSE